MPRRQAQSVAGIGLAKCAGVSQALGVHFAKSVIGKLLPWVLLVGLAGCASRPEPLPADALSVHPWGVAQPHREPASTARNVLVLSGGGAYGAYGAGFLKGWSETGTRPDFEVVTGVSTGSIIATCAFLGADYDELLREMYTSFQTSDLLNLRFLPTAMFYESLLTSAPLARRLEEFISDEMIDAVAQRHRQGKRLYAGTTNLDTRQFTVWDLGAIAASADQARYAQFRKIVLASASIPIAFEPVYFEVQRNGEHYGQMHVDGGVTGPIFLEPWMLKNSQAPAPVNGHVYVILNLPYGEDDYQPVKPDLPSITEASFATLMQALNESRLAEAYALAVSRSYEFSYAAVPATYAEDNNPLRFERDYLEALFAKGQADARQPQPWLREVIDGL